ncbi:hypothetical protein [Pseudalkalibacillus hwajinpoensis]
MKMGESDRDCVDKRIAWSKTFFCGKYAISTSKDNAECRIENEERQMH